MDVQRALSHCERVTRAHSSSFTLGSSLFPPGKRRAVRVLYAVCRAGDDAVDAAPGAEAARRDLERWWAGVERAYAGAPRPAPLELALAWVLERHELPRHGFEELRRGFETDLGSPRLQTLDELRLYCRRVAGAVGWLVAPIAGYRGGDATLDHARELGEAMQLTNVLRDVGEDLALDRCYLPAERLEHHGVSLAALRRGELPDGYVALLEELAGLARGLYRQGWKGIPSLEGSASLAVGVAALNYEGILRKLRQNGWDNLTRRAHLRPVERLATIPRAVLGARGLRA